MPSTPGHESVFEHEITTVEDANLKFNSTHNEKNPLIRNSRVSIRETNERINDIELQEKITNKQTTSKRSSIKRPK